MKSLENKYNSYPITSKIVTLYVGIMFFVYPLYYQNYYYDIVTCRFYLFVIMTGITVLLCLAGYYVESGAADTRGRKLLTGADWLVLALWAVNLVSALLSDNMQVAVMGTSGRSSGLITLTGYAAVYFMVTRFYVHSIRIFQLLCVSSIAASIVGSLHFLDIDFLGFYDGLGAGEKAMYLSTMGHANVVASFYGLVLPMVMVLFINTDKWKEQIFYGITLVLSVSGLFATGCESGAIIIGVMFLAGLVTIQDIRNQYKLFVISICMVVICKILLVINDRKQMPRSLETFQRILENHTRFIILLLALFLIGSVSYWLYQGKSRKNIETGICKNKQYVKRILMFACIFIFVFIGGILFFSTVGKNIRLGKLENMLRFNKRFGSYRGYIWELVLREYGKLPFINQLFGIGCDTLKPFLMEFHRNEMYVTTGAYYDNAHNEFLQYLITTGILGLSCYVSLLFIKLRTGIRIMTENNSLFTAAAVFGVLGYLMQSIVDINQCVTTPLFVIMISTLGCNENYKRK